MFEPKDNSTRTMGLALLDEASEYLSTPLDSEARSKGYSAENRDSLRQVIDVWRDELIGRRRHQISSIQRDR